MTDPDFQPDYNDTCHECGKSPTVSLTGDCAEHTFDTPLEVKAWEKKLKVNQGRLV